MNKSNDKKRKTPEDDNFEVGTGNVPTFIHKLYEILSDSHWNKIIAFHDAGKAFIVKKPNELAEKILPKYWKHNNYASFVRQLNMYDFHKTKKSPNEHYFWHPLFQQGQKHLLKDIKRKIGNSDAVHLLQGGEIDLTKKNDTKQVVQGLLGLQQKHHELEHKFKELERKNKELMSKHQALWQEFYKSKEREQALERLVLVVFASLASQGLPLMEDRGTGAEGKGMLLQKPFPGEIQYWLRKLITDSMKHNLLTNAGNTPIPQPLLPDYGDPLVQGGGGENNCSRGNNEGESAQDALTQSLAQFTSGGGPQNYPGLGALMKGEGRDRLNSFQIKGNLDDTDYSIYKLEKEFNEGDRKSIGGPINSPLLASPTPLHLDSPYSRSYIGDPSIPNYLKHLELSPAPSPYPNSPKPPTDPGDMLFLEESKNEPFMLSNAGSSAFQSMGLRGQAEIETLSSVSGELLPRREPPSNMMNAFGEGSRADNHSSMKFGAIFRDSEHSPLPWNNQQGEKELSNIPQNNYVVANVMPTFPAIGPGGPRQYVPNLNSPSNILKTGLRGRHKMH